MKEKIGTWFEVMMSKWTTMQFAPRVFLCHIYPAVFSRLIMCVNLWETVYVIAYTTEVIQAFSDLISEIPGQKCIFNAWIVISRVILCMSYYVLTLVAFSFCY